MTRKFKLHFVGIGGSGMSGIAHVFCHRGHTVTGSDLAESETTQNLQKMGVKIYLGHKAEHVGIVDAIVVSSAVRPDNPELVQAKKLGIPVIPRAEMLAELMRGKTGIAVGGTHGKTTTTTMIGKIFLDAGLDPTVIVGGKVEAFAGNAKSGDSEWVIAEADESDGSFHFLPSVYSVVTNIDNDHLDFYKDQAAIDDAFLSFVRKIPFFGSAWLCGDDAGVQRILPRMTKPFRTYGFLESNSLYAQNLEFDALQQRSIFHVTEKQGENKIHHGRFELNALGEHNVKNSLAAIGIALDAGIDVEKIKSSLASFRHARRRFDLRLDRNGIRIVDDYGHHPTEIEAVMKTARLLKPKRILTVFQPHRYSRTAQCWNQFPPAFEETDLLFLLPIYAAGESEIFGINQEKLASSLQTNTKSDVILVHDLDSAAKKIADVLTDGDLLITLGAGSVTKLPDLIEYQLKEKWAREERSPLDRN